MLKNRIIGCVLVKNGIAVQSIGFRKFLPIGKAEIAVEFLSDWDIDEIVVLNINSDLTAPPDFELIERLSSHSFVPLTAGGKVKSTGDVNKFLRAGADKVTINTSAINNSKFIAEASDMFGSQCIVVSVDVKKVNDSYQVFSQGGKKATGLNAFDHIQNITASGAGEILLNSIDRDGSKSGFDMELYSEASKHTDIPIIACGGAGHPEHFLQCISQCNISSLAAGNFFNFTEHSPLTLKSFLKSKMIRGIRFGTKINYSGFEFDEEGRVEKLSDRRLTKSKYIPVEMEII